MLILSTIAKPKTKMSDTDGGFNFFTPKFMWPLLIIFFILLLLVLVAFTVITGYQRLTSTTEPPAKPPREDEDDEDDPHLDKPVDDKPTDKPKPLRNLEVNTLCNSYYRRLPNSKKHSQDKYNSTSNAECEFVFFGFVDDYNVVRHRSLSDENKWMTMRKEENGRLPFHYKDCYEFKLPEFGIPTVVYTEKCEVSTDKTLLFLTNNAKACGQRQFKCVEIFNWLPKQPRHQRYWVSSVLMNYYSLQSLKKMLATGSVVVMPIDNKLLFKYRGSRSDKFAVVDPENDCVAYDIERNKVVSRDCEDKECSICSVKMNLI